MTLNPRLKRIFPEPPMICWTRPKNLREYLIRSQLPKQLNFRKSERNKNGFKHCKRNCKMCKFSPNFAKFVTCSKTNVKYPILSPIDCTSKNVIYCITCTKQNGCCKNMPQYIGETGRSVCERLKEHVLAIKPETKFGPGKHFYGNGHVESHLSIIPLEKIRSEDYWIRQAREKFYIRAFDASLNKKF